MARGIGLQPSGVIRSVDSQSKQARIELSIAPVLQVNSAAVRAFYQIVKGLCAIIKTKDERPDIFKNWHEPILTSFCFGAGDKIPFVQINVLSPYLEEFL